MALVTWPLHGKRCHPQSQGKTERCLQSLKNVVKPDHNNCLEELTQSLPPFVHYHNHQRNHELLDNVILADMYVGKRKQILS